MMQTKKSLEDLNMLDDFLMSAVTSNQEVGAAACRLILSTLLEREIGEVEIVAQKIIPALTPKLRGIRLDVEIIEKLPIGELTKEKTQPLCRVYDLEPHIQNNLNLPRHNRFYQARIDSRYLKRGEDDFACLPELYVLTITPYDPFGEDYMVYTVQNRCNEVPGLLYEDGLQYIYFYTKGTKGGTPAIKAMLEYFQNSCKEQAVNEELRELHRYVSEVKLSPEMRDEYMLLEDYIYYEKRDAAHERHVLCILELLEDLGPVPEKVKKYLEQERRTQLLSHWHKLAAHAKSMEDFISACGFDEEV